MTANAIAETLRTIEQKGAMTGADVAEVLDIRRETVSRWNQGKSAPQRDTERVLLELAYIVRQLSDIYQPQQARLWLFSRQKLLHDKRPAELIRSGKIEHVLAVVNRLRDDVYL